MKKFVRSISLFKRRGGKNKLAVKKTNVQNIFFIDLFYFASHICLQTLSAVVFIVCKQKLGCKIAQNYRFLSKKLFLTIFHRKKKKLLSSMSAAGYTVHF